MKIQIIYLVRESNCDPIEHKILDITSIPNTSEPDLIKYITSSLEKYESKTVSFDLHNTLLSIAYVILDGKLMRIEEKASTEVVRRLY